MASLIKFNIDFSFTDDQEIISDLYGNIGILLKEVEVSDCENYKKVYKAFFKGKNMWLKKEDFNLIEISS